MGLSRVRGGDNVLWANIVVLATDEFGDGVL
jgi:hypothetical protein